MSLRHLAYALPALPGFAPPKTYAAWPVWSGSTTAEVQWPKVVKQAFIEWYHKANYWNALKQAAGRYGGTLGSSCLRVYECFIWGFQNYDTGQLDPSYRGIAAKTGLGRTTVWKALTRLKELRMIHSQKRCRPEKDEAGQFRLRQRTNAYMLLPPSQWLGFDAPPEAPPPEPGTWGDHPPLPDQITQAAEELQHGARKTALAMLEADPNDKLAAALARLGQAIEEKEEREKSGKT